MLLLLRDAGGRSGLLRQRVAGKLSGELVEVALADHLAVAVELRIEFDLQTLHMKVALNDAAALERQRVLHVEIALDRPEEINILANDVTLDDGLFADGDAALRENLAFESTVDADVVGG